MAKRAVVAYRGSCPKHGQIHRLEAEDGRRLFNWSNGAMHCAECRRAIQWTPIAGRTSDMPCGEKCISATGPSCDCACGGENHGRNG
jgi:hypothetical protein